MAKNYLDMTEQEQHAEQESWLKDLFGNAPESELELQEWAACKDDGPEW